MVGHRRLVAVGAAASLALLGSGSAFAATPQTIYRDMADNGRLDGKYTRADIERAFDLPLVVREDEHATPRKPIGEPAAHEAAKASTPRNRPDRRVPFSALDAALLAAAAGPLLLIGVGLRRRLATPDQAPVASG
jgi:hypothetical protein